MISNDWVLGVGDVSFYEDFTNSRAIFTITKKNKKY